MCAVCKRVCEEDEGCSIEGLETAAGILTQRPGALQLSYIKGCGLWRNTGCLEICVCNSNHLPRHQIAESYGSAGAVCESGFICNIESSLIINIVGVRCNKIVIVKINQNNPSGRYR